MKNYMFLTIGLIIALFFFASLASACWFDSYSADISTSMMGPFIFLFMTLFGFLVILVLLLLVAVLAKWLLDHKTVEKRTIEKENKVL